MISQHRTIENLEFCTEAYCSKQKDSKPVAVRETAGDLAWPHGEMFTMYLGGVKHVVFER